MINKLITITLSAMLLFSCSTKNNQQEIEKALSDFDGMSLDEAKEYLIEKNSQFQQFAAFFGDKPFFGDGEVKNYTKEEESYDKLPTFAKPEDIERSYNTYFSNAYLSQEYKYPQTEIRIKEDKYSSSVEDVDYWANKIFFRDGSVDDSKQKIGKWVDLNTAKIIDSIQVTAKYSYTESPDQYEVKNKTNFDGGSIKIDKIQGNMVKLTLTGKAKNYEKIVALNEEGKVLDSSSSSSETKGAGKIGKAYAKAFEKLANKADDFKSVEELKEAVKKTFAKLPSLNADVESTYTGFFRGNVSSVIVYIPANTISKEVNFTLVNKNANTQKLIYAFDTEKEKYGFLNQSGEFVIQPTYDGLFQENDLYYYTETQVGDSEDFVYEVYFLDNENERLVKIPEIQSVTAVTKTCVSVDKNDKKALWNEEGKAVTPYMYAWISAVEGSEKVIRIVTNNKYGLINTEGETVLAANYSAISDFTNGRALVKKGWDPQMFIDETGKQVIPLTQYSIVEEFTEGLAVVANKNNKYGFIDVNGNTVLPLIYEDAKSFSHGITLVKYEGMFGLIDKKGHFIVPAKSSGYSMTGSDKRIYYLNGLKYNEYGNVIEETEEGEEE